MNATLQIETVLRNDKTVLLHCFCTPPFKVLDITEDRTGNELHLMLMSASPGILDHDKYKIQVHAGKDCSLQLHTQSYQRLFQMEHGATQAINVQLEAGASFCFLPHPSVPHKASKFIAKNKIFLAGDCNLIWGEILTCGRSQNGERFCFSKYHAVTEIFLSDRLILKENLLLQPARTDVSAIGQMEGFTHQASLICINETPGINTLANSLYNWLINQENICFGITALPVNGLLVRLLGFKAEQLHDCLKKLAKEIREYNVMHQQAALAKTVVYAN